MGKNHVPREKKFNLLQGTTYILFFSREKLCLRGGA
jgi:hypothetical protein